MPEITTDGGKKRHKTGTLTKPKPNPERDCNSAEKKTITMAETIFKRLKSIMDSLKNDKRLTSLICPEIKSSESLLTFSSDSS
jgi:hypothetical protein